MRKLTPADYRVMPWKNGAGDTTELYMEPGPNGFIWRVSIADVAADGPFSPFPGYDRHIMTIGGGGMMLDGGPDGEIDATQAFVPQRFSGDWNISARLAAGPSRDFNLIACGNIRTSLEYVRLDSTMWMGAGFIYVIAGTLKAGEITCSTDDGLLLDRGEMVGAVAMAQLAVCRVG